MRAAGFSLRSVRYRASSLTKQALIELGKRTPAGALYSLNGIVNHLETGAFVRRRGFDTNRRGSSRFHVFNLIASEVARRRVLYLEFGVASGGTIRYWSKLLLNPDSVLHGFDSFEGLPTDWIRDFPAGFFPRAANRQTSTISACGSSRPGFRTRYRPTPLLSTTFWS